MEKFGPGERFTPASIDPKQFLIPSPAQNFAVRMYKKLRASPAGKALIGPE
jgi:hypothetical protein